MRYSGKGLVLLLIFSTPVVGQEAGDKARGELRPSSIHFELFQMSKVGGVITPGLLQLEMGDGSIIARDDLINPEYFDTTRPSFLGTLVAGPIVGVVVKFVVDQSIDRVACSTLSTLLPGESGYKECREADGSLSYLEMMGLGAAVMIPIWAIYPYFFGEWKPW